ncbi:MAG: 5-formyltetrahydrofolate cyclo-ligase [Pseudorhodobacter sp.]|nr:5-formyltetrahydrofolate cyclo-ligase [Pseudorhodobacter sp.]
MTEKSAPDATGSYASPPCYAHEVDPTYFDPLAVDARQATDVARWRQAERVRLRTARLAVSAEARATMAQALATHLDALLAGWVGDVAGRVISGYWPIKAELDLRFWLTGLHARGALVALPLVETRAAPLVFRRWKPGMTMMRGHWNIPVPPPEAEQVTPGVALAPVMGWDAAGYRLGYGGGYFDRTLAALTPRPLVIGVGMQSAAIATIYPQPHDIAMDVIVTEAGVQVNNAQGKPL